MNIDKIKQVVGSMAKTIEENETLATPFLVAKLAKAIDAYPQDQTIGLVHRVLEKMAYNDKMFITKKSFRDLYSKHYYTNTKFSSVFKEELGEVAPLATPVHYASDEATNVPTYQGDAVLANALGSLFNNEPIRLYSQEIANRAVAKIASSLDILNLNPSHLNVEEGSEKFIVVRADYETPKGKTSILIPVEINNNKLVNASVFVGNSGPQDLNYESVKKYITTSAGNKLTVSGSIILQALNKAVGDKKEISASELALIKLKASRQTQSEFFADSVVGLSLNKEAQKDVYIPKSSETTNFEKQFGTTAGFAEFVFGDRVVKSGAEMIVKKITSFGYYNPQVQVLASGDNSISYGVSLQNGKIAFTVPVKIENKSAVSPNLLVSNGSVMQFSSDSVEKLCIANQTDHKIAAATSAQFGLKASDLVNNIRQAMSEENYAKAEDSLNVLASYNDETAYAVGFSIFMNGISGKTVKTSASTCDRIIKNSASNHDVCGHTGLPLHKVYTDKQGNCRPTYRQGIDESYEAATFMNSKIFG